MMLYLWLRYSHGDERDLGLRAQFSPLDLTTELLTVISGKFNNCIPRNNIKFNIFLIYQYPPKRRFTNDNDHQEGKHGRQNTGPSNYPWSNPQNL